MNERTNERMKDRTKTTLKNKGDKNDQVGEID